MSNQDAEVVQAVLLRDDDANRELEDVYLAQAFTNFRDAIHEEFHR